MIIHFAVRWIELDGTKHVEHYYAQVTDKGTYIIHTFGLVIPATN